MKQIAQSIWRFSWLVTLPVSVLFLYWLWATGEQFYTFKMRYDPSPDAARLLEFGTTEFWHTVRRVKLAVRQTLEPTRNNDPDVADVFLYATEADLAQLNSRLPQSGFNFIEARLFNNGKLRKVKMRYRGDNFWHWGRYKKSIRVKTKKSQLYDGMRSFNLIAPKFDEHIRNYVSYRLADDLGLIAPRTEFVNVVLNGERQGIHLLTEQLDEVALRSRGLMPGDIYSGELIAKDEHAGVSRQVWEHPGLWEKQAFNSHYPEDSRKPLGRLIELINSVPSESVDSELSRLLDIEAWGRFMAFETLTQSFHFSGTHNWRLYFDPVRSRFVPIVWDPMGWSWSRHAPAQLDVLTSQMQMQLSRHGDVLRERHRAIEDFYQSGSRDEFVHFVESAVSKMESSLIHDPNVYPVDLKRISNAMRDYSQTIIRTLDEIEHGWLAEGAILEYAASTQGDGIAISFTGRQPVERLIFQYADPLLGELSTLMRFWRDGRRVEIELSDIVYRSANRIEIRAKLLPNFESETNDQPPSNAHAQQLKSTTAYFEFLIDGIEQTNRLLDVLAERGADGVVRAERVENLDRRSFGMLHAVVPDPLSTSPRRWEGEVELSGFTEIDEPLILAPGTSVRLKPGATLVVHNRIIADGTAEQPISFLPADDDEEPWGTIAIDGQSDGGSTFSHCEFAGGSGLKGDLSDYSGMLSFHDAGRVDITHTRLRDNRMFDDMLHAVYSEVHLRDCEFTRAAADAADFDLCRVTIVNCAFEESGNDGVDLMGSHAIVSGTVFRANKDKGVSVGEKSRLLAIDNLFSHNEIGVQSKDASVAILYNIDFAENGLALDAYLKNWRYSAGGTAYVYKSRLTKNERTMTADRNSHIWVYDCYSDNPIDSKRVTLDRFVDNTRPQGAGSRARFPGKRQAPVWVEHEFWNRAKPNRRGSAIAAD